MYRLIDRNFFEVRELVSDSIADVDRKKNRDDWFDKHLLGATGLHANIEMRETIWEILSFLMNDETNSQIAMKMPQGFSVMQGFRSDPPYWRMYRDGVVNSDPTVSDHHIISTMRGYTRGDRHCDEYRIFELAWELERRGPFVRLGAILSVQDLLKLFDKLLVHASNSQERFIFADPNEPALYKVHCIEPFMTVMEALLNRTEEKGEIEDVFNWLDKSLKIFFAAEPKIASALVFSIGRGAPERLRRLDLEYINLWTNALTDTTLKRQLSFSLSRVSTGFVNLQRKKLIERNFTTFPSESIDSIFDQWAVQTEGVSNDVSS